MGESNQACSGKLVLVGDGACGKTCLLEVFKRNKFPEEYIPTVVDNFVKEVSIGDGRTVSLALWDTAGQEAYDSVRPMSYSMTDLVILCYSVESEEMLPNITKKWITEIKNFCPNTGFFLIGLKKDLRDDEDPSIEKNKMVSYELGEKIALENEATRFMECSAKTGENVQEVFKEAAIHIMEVKSKNSGGKKCFCC
jgi:Ras homolog gene family, member A